MLMLKGKKYDTPSLFEGSIHDDRRELEGLLNELEGILEESAFDGRIVKEALVKIENVVGETIDHGYPDSKVHQIDVLMRDDHGLNIVIRDDSKNRIMVPEGIKRAYSLDMNIYYINIQNPNPA